VEGKPRGFTWTVLGEVLTAVTKRTPNSDNSFESQNWRPFGPESYSLVLGAPSETTSFHLIIEKPRCLLLGSINAPHTRAVLSVREGEAVHDSVTSSLFGRPRGLVPRPRHPTRCGSLKVRRVSIGAL
jgi:hypothetical protein